ncbi:mannose-ethanolamine phosphotransferase gpi13, partial [Linderina pennispora]
MAEPQSPSETPVAKPSKLPVRGHWSLSVFFVVANAIGFWLFARGFLLTRMVLSDHSHSLVLPFEQSHSTPAPDAANASWYPAKFERSIVLVVDALRIDFATFSSELNATDDRVRKMPYHNNLPIIDRVMQSRPSHSMLYRFRADPPTTTLQRLKALTTGQLPTFIDAGSNFAGSAIDEDNWLQAIRGREGSGYKRNLVFLGDDTWSSLFPNELADT